jgi:hypothetical protein
LAAVALVALAACGDGDDEPTVAGQSPTTTAASGPATTQGGVTSTTPTTTGTVLAVTVRGGSVVEGASRQRATLNQPVTIRVTSDVAEEVHVHGYDKRVDVAAGRTGEVTFLANIPGVFEVEFERSHKLLFTLEVR